MKDQTASIQARLRNLAINQNKDFTLLIRLYMQEGVLKRLTVSHYADSFFLKGGLLLYSLSGFAGRPTKGIDSLGKNVNNDPDNLKQIMKEIPSINTEYCLSFIMDEFFQEQITEGADYHGQRIKIPCFLGNIKTMLTIDIGFEDIIYPEPIKFDYPTLLEAEPFKINSYTLESIVSEKFEAMIILDDVLISILKLSDEICL